MTDRDKVVPVAPAGVADRRQLRQIISGLSEGVILIEPDQSISWANQAALDMHGANELADLGSTVSAYRGRFQLRYRNHHKLARGQYPIDRVIAGEVFDDVVVEVTRADDNTQHWVHRVRSLVLTDADGAPDCLVLIIADASDWASAEQRFERTFNANPAPALICRLQDLRYIKVNLGFQEMTGYSREEVIGRSVYELDVFEQAERRELAVERLGEGATIPQMQAELRLPDGSGKCVMVAGQPIEMGEEPCMLFTFMDLEPRRKAEEALRASEERFVTAFRISPVPTLICLADRLLITEVNEAVAQGTGFEPEELLGKTLEESRLFAEPARYAELRRALENGASVHNQDYVLRRKDGGRLDCLLSAEVVSIHGIECYLLCLLDISDRKRSELELVTAIETVMQDASWFSQSLLEKLANVRRSSQAATIDSSLADLTAREREVLGWICAGLADKEIAGRLAISPHTVRNHVATLYSKLNVHSRGEAIVWARERGFHGADAAAGGKQRRR